MDINWFHADYLPWLILLFPLVSFLVIVLFTSKSTVLSQVVGLVGIGLSWALSMLLFVKTVWASDPALGERVYGSALDWMSLGRYTFRMGVLVDPLTAYMLLMVPLACLMIFIYSVGYMRGDAHNSRFFAYISLFAGAMLTLVLADNLLLLFIGWEVMGFCSYSLIGFWAHKKTAMEAGVKAFMTTRVADVLMLVGIGYLFLEARTLNFRDILYNEEMLHHLASTDAILFGGSVAGLVGVLLVIGTITALGAAVLALGQNDIKRILAYSTISQLGYMVAALGIGAWVAAAFHLINHAFFKALLFMASGSVIHAMEHGEHHAAEHGHAHTEHEEPDGLVMDYVAPPNDIQRMGGLIHRIPVTAITMAIGGLSLAGFPLITAGFWSKDEIIAEAWHGMSHDPFPLFVLLALVIAAFLTAFYTARMWLLTFWGQPRTPAAEFATPGTFRKQWVVWWNKRGWNKDIKLMQEPTTARDRLSFAQMETPLIILSFFAISAGFIGTPAYHALHDFLAPTLLEEPLKIDFNIAPMLLSIALALGGLGLGWWVYAVRPLRQGEIDPTERALGAEVWRVLQNRFYIDILYRRYLLRPVEWFAVNIVIQAIDKETIDGVLETIAEAFTWLGEAFKRFNTVVIDGVGDGIPRAIGDFGKWFRQVQSGRIQHYLLYVTLALLALGTLFLVQVR